MAKLLYVVHRYAPYPGGSEYNVQRYAEASLALGHDVTVLTLQHRGDLNGVKVTSDFTVLNNEWDCIIVHGDAPAQDIVHSQEGIKSPIFYLLIRAHEDEIVIKGMKNATWIGCATTEDRDLVYGKGFGSKYRGIRYGIEIKPIEKTEQEIKNIFGLNEGPIFISCGGFAPHKGMAELAELFCKLERNDVTLVLTGYDLTHGVPDFYSYGKEHGKNIIPFALDTPQQVYDLMSVSDLLIWNSLPGTEGYGLVLLESMAYGCNWIGRDMVAAHDLAERGLGVVYNEPHELQSFMENFDYANDLAVTAESYAKKYHDIKSATADMLGCIGL